MLAQLSLLLALRVSAPTRLDAQTRSPSESALTRESIAAWERAVQLGECDPGTGAWQISRAYARLGNQKQALRWRRHAVDFGFDEERAMSGERGLETREKITLPVSPPAPGRRTIMAVTTA